MLFDRNKQATVNSFILDNAPSKWKLHCWLKREVYTRLLGVCRDNMVVTLRAKNETIRMRGAEKTVMIVK